MLDCVHAFETAAPWWGNVGPDERLIATLKRFGQYAQSAGRDECVVSNAALTFPRAANTNADRRAHEPWVA